MPSAANACVITCSRCRAVPFPAAGLTISPVVFSLANSVLIRVSVTATAAVAGEPGRIIHVKGRRGSCEACHQAGDVASGLGGRCTNGLVAGTEIDF